MLRAFLAFAEVELRYDLRITSWVAFATLWGNTLFYCPLVRRLDCMTEQEAMEKAREQIRAEKAAYMREWRKRNPKKDKAIRDRYRAKLKAARKEGKPNE